MEKELKAKIRIHLYTEDKCFGPGICLLLEQIEEYGSLRRAAISMDMAYSKAWKIVKDCEKNLGFKLLCSTTGGKSGGGAKVTDEAKKMMAAYRQYCAEIEDASDRIIKDIFSFYPISELGNEL